MDKFSSTVSRIIQQVRARGEQALCDYARRFDKIALRPGDIVVPPHEIKKAKERVSPMFLKAIQECAKNVESFAKAEKRRLARSWIDHRGSGTVGQLIRPVDSVGLYIPGGRFPYPSTVLMTAIPARIAGVGRIVMASPPKNLTPEVLAAADFVGCDAVYRMGGAGAIAALAYGTPRIRPVDIIIGPGNQYVTEAKRQIFGQAGIDLLAGPSEVVIIADDSAPVEFVAMDLLAQAEHDPEARSVLLSTSAKLLESVRERLNRDIAGRVKIKRVASLRAAVEEANAIAPEHLELLVRKADRCLPWIRHAGAIFLGPATPAAMGDYVAGPSHVLPTHGAARFSSGLSVATFMKRSSIIGFQARSGERSRWEAALTMAQTEGMTYHEKSLQVRMSSR